MNKIATACCYYGKLPGYFPFFVSSVKRNGFIDFLLFTDGSTALGITDIPENLKIKILPFEELKERVQSLFPFKITLASPYKLCDYKFAYGEIFKEEFSPYEFFGWNDIDVIFGDMSRFLTKEALDCDVIGSLGHFTLMRNTEKLRSFYRESENCSNLATCYKRVFREKNSCYFDEIYGLNKMSWQLKTYDLSPYVADIMPYKGDFYVFHREGEGKFIIKYKSGKLYKIFKDREEEVAYVHMQKRKFVIKNASYEEFYITPEAFSASAGYEEMEAEDYPSKIKALDKSYKTAERINKKSVFKKRIKNKLKKNFN